MMSWATAVLPSGQLVSLPDVGSRTLPRSYTCSACFFKPCAALSRSGIFTPQIIGKHSNGILSVVRAGWTSLQSNVGLGEELDDESGSEYENEDEDEEEEEGEENDLDFESDWEEEKPTSVASLDGEQTAINYEEELLKEIEELLSPEEREIWQQNLAPNLGRISTGKWSLLHTLASSGQIRYLDQLLENGVDINATDKDGYTALHISVISKKEAVTSHLLRKGANPHVKDKDGATPLHYALQVGAMQTVKLLIKFNADINSSDNEGWTPLHVAMQTRNRDITKVLLLNGADKSRRNKDGKTPLDLSLAYGKDFNSYDLTKLLKTVPANRDF